jgi:hypothetical protein
VRVRYKTFPCDTRGAEAAFGDAAPFATKVGRDRLIGITQSDGRDTLFSAASVTVWYWDADPPRPPAAT